MYVLGLKEELGEGWVGPERPVGQVRAVLPAQQNRFLKRKYS